MENVKKFDFLVGMILGDLYKTLPVHSQLVASDYLERIVNDDNYDEAFSFDVFFSATVRWLERYGYVDIDNKRQTLSTVGFSLCLSEKGLHTLRKMPKSIAGHRTLGEMLSQTSKGIAKETLSKLITDLVAYGVNRGTDHFQM